METIRTHLLTIADDKIRTRAIANAEAQRPWLLDDETNKVVDLEQALWNAFNWHITPEGVAFWEWLWEQPRPQNATFEHLKQYLI